MLRIEFLHYCSSWKEIFHHLIFLVCAFISNSKSGILKKQQREKKMGLFDRFRRKPDTAELEEAMEQAVLSERSAKKRLQEINASLAILKAHDQDAQRRLRDAQDEIDKLTGYIESLVARGDESGARDLIRQKLQLEEKLPELEMHAKEAASNLQSLQTTQDEIRREYGNFR